MAFTIEVGFNLIATLAFFYGFYISLRQVILGQKYRFYYFAIFTWFFYTLYYLISGIAVYILSIELYRISLIFLSVGNIVFLCKVDTLKRESIEPIKLALLAVIVVIGIILVFSLSNAIYLANFSNGDSTIQYNLILTLTFGAAYFIPTIYFLFYVRELYVKAPKIMKSLALRYLIGVILCVIGVLLVAFGVATFIPGILQLSTGIGAILMASAYAKEPKLLFILPFKALRLSVMDTQSGISIFSHTWNAGNNLADDVLFSGMIQGINAIIKESVKRGAVQEIRMADAIMMTSYDARYPVAAILIATNPSKSLRDSLTLFSQKFNEIYHTYYDNCSDINQFKDASDLVTLCFPFVPEYD